MADSGRGANGKQLLEEMTIEANHDKAFEEATSHMSPFEKKNMLLSFAREETKASSSKLLNAGRGNPNWIAMQPRQAFFLLGQFAMQEASRSMVVPGVDIAGMPQAAGAATRFAQFLAAHEGEPGQRLLSDAVAYAQRRGWDADAVVDEWSQGIAGCEYPMPERILKYTEQIVGDYFRQEVCGGAVPQGGLDLFATEGGTAAMCYVFYCLKCNFLIHEGDTMALMTPIFTPYIEIPQLNDYALDVVNVNASTMNADGTHAWQYPDEELEKLADPKVKLLCLVNPSNPPSYAMDEASRRKLIDIVRTKNPNLMIITDDVYGTFVPGYRSLFADLPYNTISIYSFSKYFGATGWRLAVAAVAQRNVFDDLIAALPDDRKQVLASRYSSLGDDVPAIRFIDRMVADSRLVALNGTAGLGTPQQVQMSLFALFSLLDGEGLYRRKMLELVGDRFSTLWKSLGWTVDPDPLRAGYYSVVDLELWGRKLYGDAFVKWLEATYEPFDFVLRLAKDTGIVVMGGDGFDAPEWSIRVSLANLNIEDYETIGRHIVALLGEYADVWQRETGAAPAPGQQAADEAPEPGTSAPAPASGEPSGK